MKGIHGHPFSENTDTDDIQTGRSKHMIQNINPCYSLEYQVTIFYGCQTPCILLKSPRSVLPY